MRKRNRSATADFEIGYRRPPKKTRFTAGKSGNPKGRPKGIRTIGAILSDVIQQKIAVTENGITRRRPALEVMMLRLRNDAMRSDPKATKLLLSLLDRYAETMEPKVQLSELLAEDQEILAQYLPEPSKPAPERAERTQSAAPEFDEKADEVGRNDVD